MPDEALRPYLVALSVPNIGESIAWYTTHLDFTVVSDDEFAEYGLRIAILERSEFRLELIESVDSVSADSLLVDMSNPVALQGIVKLAFWVDDIDAHESHFRDSDITFSMEPRDNRNKGSRSFIVLDNSGNWIQLVGNIRSGQ
jgi:catechol 2,3-dioxygenase-like lactoylglutathione lyase family enzyme